MSENHHGDHHLEEEFHNQLKRRTQCIGESLLEFAPS
jgi:hypothetical protein